MKLIGKISWKRDFSLGEACSWEREYQVQRPRGRNILGVKEEKQEGRCGSSGTSEVVYFKHVCLYPDENNPVEGSIEL